MAYTNVNVKKEEIKEYFDDEINRIVNDLIDLHVDIYNYYERTQPNAEFDGTENDDILDALWKILENNFIDEFSYQIVEGNRGMDF